MALIVLLIMLLKNMFSLLKVSASSKRELFCIRVDSSGTRASDVLSNINPKAKIQKYHTLATLCY